MADGDKKTGKNDKTDPVTGLPVDKFNKKRFAAEYGVSKAVLDQNKELQTFLDSILAEQKAGRIWTDLDIARKFKETNWFKQHTSDWMAIQKDRASKDPALWDAVVGARAEELTRRFESEGASIDDATARKYAEQMIYGSGWNGKSFDIYDESYIQDTIASAIDFTKTKTVNGIEMYDYSGKAEELSNSLYKTAQDYGFDTSMSNSAFTNWFQKSVKGVMDGSVQAQDVDDELRDNAMSRFPGLAKQLQRGMSLRDAASPYTRAIADTLELDESQISLDDNLIQNVLNYSNGDNGFQPMNLYDTKKAARRDSRWQYTETARKEYTDMASSILKDFGFLG